jgi:hypothetical protein
MERGVEERGAREGAEGEALRAEDGERMTDIGGRGGKS